MEKQTEFDKLQKEEQEITDAPDEIVAEVSNALMVENMEAYKELAK